MTAMRAAIYARKSTDQSAVSAEEKSVSRQIEHASAYAKRKGWTVDDRCVFVDDGVSGAEFQNRPGYMRLLNALKPRAPFDVLVVSELSRLGREQLETGYACKQLSQAGVQIFSYLDDRQIALDSATDIFMLSAANFAASMEREKARQRTYDALQRKALAGHVTGGRLFGYDNIRVDSHTERRINEPEAAVVRRIFALCAEGRGQSAIAKLLNAEHAVSPRSQQGRPRAWAPSSVREALFREAYRGRIVWNRSKKRDTWGQVKQTERRQDEWLEVDAPALRIVSDDLWTAAHARLGTARAAYLKVTGGQRFGRPSRDVESKYLLTGLARCGRCGGSMYVKKRKVGKERIHVYGCTSYHRRGASVCSNHLEMPMVLADKGIVSALLRDIVNPTVLRRIVDRAMAKSQPTDSAPQEAKLRQQLAAVERETNRLVSAIAVAGDVPALAEAVRQRQQDRDALQAALLALRQPTVDLSALRSECEARVEEWASMLAREAVTGRAVLKKLLASSPIVFTPHTADTRIGYAFSIDVPVGNFLQRPTVPGGDATIVASLKTTGFIELPSRRAA